MTEPLLRVNSIETFYGPIQAIRGVSLDVDPGQIVTVLGANGAGKTSVLRTISGVLDPERGQVMFEGRDIARMPPDQVMRLGICHVPEGREIFPFLTVRENLNDGRLYAPRYRRRRQRHRTVLRLLPPAEGTRAPARRPAVGRRAADAGDQPRADGQAETAAAGRAVAGPVAAAGAADLRHHPPHQPEQNVAILLVEQNAHIALQTADYGYVLEVGRIVAADDCATLMQRDDIKEFYLGQKEAGARGTRRWKKKRLWN